MCRGLNRKFVVRQEKKESEPLYYRCQSTRMRPVARKLDGDDGYERGKDERIQRDYTKYLVIHMNAHHDSAVSIQDY